MNNLLHSMILDHGSPMFLYNGGDTRQRGLNEIEIINRSGISFFSTFFKATSLSKALAQNIGESTIEILLILDLFHFEYFDVFSDLLLSGKNRQRRTE